METAEEFAQHVMQAFADDHLLSREALPVFIATALEHDRNATRLALLEEVTELTVQLIMDAPGHPDSLDRIQGAAAIAIRKTREKYQAAEAQPVQTEENR
jgi:hypothetical protein